MRSGWIGLTLVLVAVALALPAAAEEGEFVDLDTCAACHDEEAAAFAAGPHGRAIARRSADLLQRACAACHGSGLEHMEDPNPENIRRLPEPEACLTCHQDSSGALFLATPGHLRHGTACLDCHASGHEDPGTEALLQAAAQTLCGGCHARQASASRQPFAHREGAEPFACTSCHAVHATGRLGRLAQLADGGVCIDCHTEKAGPFIFPHPPREIDGCLNCHQPHGSTNPRLLKRRQVLNLCLECHANVPAFHDLTRARFRACQSCHVAVHGSNRDPRLLDD